MGPRQPHRIRVNAICPTVVDTPMVQNEAVYSIFAGGEEGSREAMRLPARTMNLLPVDWVQPIDISNALLWLSSDDARYVTGVALPIDAGFMNQPSGIPTEIAEMLAAAG